jgi:hypothetical protein
MTRPPRQMSLIAFMQAPVGSLTLTIPESRFARSKLRAYVALQSEEARLLSSARMS